MLVHTTTLHEGDNSTLLASEEPQLNACQFISWPFGAFLSIKEACRGGPWAPRTVQMAGATLRYFKKVQYFGSTKQDFVFGEMLDTL